MAVSSHEVAGRALGDLDLPGRFTATATRVRRGDVDLLATDDLVLALGDRVRVVAPRERLPEVASVPRRLRARRHRHQPGRPLPRPRPRACCSVSSSCRCPAAQTLSLGVAGGPLLMGLVLGRLQRSGPVLWSLPHSVSSTLSQFGMLAFLAYAGSTSGAALAKALASDIGPAPAGRRVRSSRPSQRPGCSSRAHLTGAYGPALAGVVAGTQTQPAVLAYSNDITEGRPAGQPRLRPRLPGRDDREGDPRATPRRHPLAVRAHPTVVSAAGEAVGSSS